jgi:hypothetical protein
MRGGRSLADASAHFKKLAESASEMAFRARTADGSDWWTLIAKEWQALAAIAERHERSRPRLMDTLAKTRALDADHEP